MQDIHRFPTPTFVTGSVVITELLTLGTLELSPGILVWNRTLRPWVLGLGVSLHLGIDYSLLIGFFSLTVLTAYLAFIPPETASRLILAVRDRFRRLRAAAQPVEPRHEDLPATAQPVRRDPSTRDGDRHDPVPAGKEQGRPRVASRCPEESPVHSVSAST